MFPNLGFLAIGVMPCVVENFNLVISVQSSIVSCLFCSKSQSADIGYTTSGSFLELLVRGPNHIQEKLSCIKEKCGGGEKRIKPLI